jgi:type II secretory pathway pseudopilin PulG
MRLQSPLLFGVLAAFVVVAAIIAGLVVIGSPSEIRMRRFDERRASDLAAISNAISTYRLTHESVPQQLDDLRRSQQGTGYGYSLKDPEGRPYEYAVKDASSYELCAVFATATDAGTGPTAYRSVFDKHGIGRQCFSREARAPARH